MRELLALPAVVDLRMAAEVLHVGRTKAYELARHGRFPCPLLRIGKTYRVPTAHLIRLVGLPDPESP
ncbi:helix-turn-helix domain-containing protein [Streptomyces sp. BPTC-684]|uniref:helix-turn-helix domain-containing protein n=1 Tax=Streptomyces sp. BPTC-684 TaxID=3043734 RepID=UPI0024B0490B|nr:helix-turn-helix domain-containing protein [Streptomyces sp. BPTC-684]WHM36005.1 helix-turn-helix domain-containing protein [Streptomyces sp. BPTC-684]